MSRRQALIHGSHPWLQAVAGNSAVRVFTFASGVVLARVLGPSGRGLLTVALLWPSLTTSVGAIVNTQTATFFGARFGERGLKQCVRLGLVNGVLLLGAALLVNWAMVRVQYPSVYAPANLYCLAVPFTIMSGVYGGSLLSSRRIGEFWGMRVLGSSVPFIAVLVLGAAHRLTVTAYVAASIAGFALATAAAIYAVYHARDEALPRENSPSDGAVLSYGAKIVVTSLPTQANYRLDQLLMSLLVAPSEIGEYVVATTWSSAVSVIGTAFGSVVQSDSARLDGGDRPAVARVLRNMRRSFVILSAVAIAAMLAVRLGLPLVFGQKYLPAVAPALLLCLAAVFTNAKLIIRDFGRGLGYPSLPLGPDIAGVVVRVPCLLVLLPVFGALGAGVAAVVSGAASLLALCIWTARRIPNVRGRDFVPRVADFAMLTRRKAPPAPAISVSAPSE